MNKKTVIIIIISIVIIAGLLIGFKIGSDYNKESKIRNEVKEISNVFDPTTDRSSLDEILDRHLIKNGQYKKIEELIKVYYKDLYNSLSNLEFLLDEDNFINYLSSKNIKDDRPKFLKSRDNINNSKAQLKEQYESFIALLEDEQTKLKYLEGKDIDMYYRNFFLELTNLVVNDNSKESINLSYERALNNLDVYNEIFAFLAAHEDSWNIKNDVIAFSDPTLYEEYINITNKIKKDSESFNEQS